jgi:predicted GNAT superfamily acetyltransferase
MTTPAEQEIQIRDLELVSEMREVEALQKAIWGVGDIDVVPLTQLIAARHCGGIVIGAFDGNLMVGFAYAFVSFEGGLVGMHSHMLAVKPEYRNLDLGYRLKLAQRQRAIARGFGRMTWTFDPLQSVNAHFNFSKLGVVADQYKINFYGDETSSFLHRIGTDRLWVTWLMTSRRVEERLDRRTKQETAPAQTASPTPVVQVDPNECPIRNSLVEALSGEKASIEVPSDINALQGENPELALEWREATRWAFSEAIAAGFLVEEFCRLTRGDQRLGMYLLTRGKNIDDIE